MSFDMRTPLSLSSHEKPKTVRHLIFYLGDRMEYMMEDNEIKSF